MAAKPGQSQDYIRAVKWPAEEGDLLRQGADVLADHTVICNRAGDSAIGEAEGSRVCEFPAGKPTLLHKLVVDEAKRAASRINKGTSLNRGSAAGHKCGVKAERCIGSDRV